MNASRHYDEGYHGEVHANLISNEVYYRAVAQASQAFYLSPGEAALRILDYGCGLGQFIYGLKNAAGFEISGEARRHCKGRGLHVWGRLGDVPAGQWDIVIVRHVLEHLEAPAEALRAMRQLLAPSGTLIIVLPREGHGAASYEPDVHRHLYCWNFRNLNNLLYVAGYQPYVNKYRYLRGFGVLLPLYRWGLHGLYRIAVQASGWLVRNAELYVRARAREDAEPDG